MTTEQRKEELRKTFKTNPDYVFEYLCSELQRLEEIIKAADELIKAFNELIENQTSDQSTQADYRREEKLQLLTWKKEEHYNKLKSKLPSGI